MLNLTIEDNVQIRNFLQGDDSYVPTRELQYLHERPLVKNSFVQQIEQLVELVGKKISDRKLTAYAVTLGSYGVRVGLVLNQMSPMGSLTDDQAKELAFVLRDIYQFCDDLNKKL